MVKNNKTAVITGATSGIGGVIADHLVKSGYSLIVLGRSEEKLSLTEDRLRTLGTDIKVNTVLCDLSSLASVRAACESIKGLTNSIDLLILNAGIWNFRFMESIDKIEETLQVNLLAPILMFNQLKGLIPRNEESKVIFTSSGLHQGTIRFEDIEFKNKYSGFRAYRQSKLGLVLLTRWLAKQPEHLGISFYCVHPGLVNTDLGRSAGWISRTVFKLFGKSKEKGAQTHVHLIDQEAKLLKSGEYYVNNKVTKTTPYSYQMGEAKKLWDIVEEYLRN